MVVDQNADNVFRSPNDGGKAVPRKDVAGVGSAPAQADERPKEAAGSFFGLRNWKLRSKLVAILIIPTLTALVLGGLLVADQLQQAAQFRQTADQVNFAIKVTGV